MKLGTKGVTQDDKTETGRVWISFDSDCDLSSADFVADWNSDEECQRAGPAIAANQPTGRGVEQLAEAAFPLLLDLSVGLTGAVIYDLIKGVVARISNKDQRIEIEEQRDDDGRVRFVIKSQ